MSSAGTAARHAVLALAALLGALSLPARAASPVAQPGIATPLEILGVESAGHPAVAAVVRAPVQLAGAELPAGAFSVQEEGEAIPVTVEKLAGVGLEVVLAIDTSGSMAGDALGAAKRAASDFATAMPLGVRIAVVAIGPSPSTVAGFSTERDETVHAIARLQARGNTALYDTVVEAARLFSPGTSRRVVVLLADGGDTNSRTSLPTAARSLATAGATVYAVSLETRESDLAALQALATVGAGRVVSASDSGALKATFGDIAAEVVSRYRLAWTSTHSGPTKVAVSISANGTTYRAETTASLPAPVLGARGGAGATSSTSAESPSTTPTPQPVIHHMPADAGARRIWLYIGLAASFGALLLLALFALLPARPLRRLAGDRIARFGRDRDLTSATRHAARAGQRILERSGQRATVSGLLERAGMQLQPGEAVVLAVTSALVAFLFGLAVAGLVIGVASAVLAVAALTAFAELRADQRQGRFAQQLEAALQLMTTTLRAGYGLAQAIDTVGKETSSPMSEEFRRVMLETRLGKDQMLALRDAAQRVRSEDLEWVVDAMEVNRDVGGNLTEVLDNVAATIRERNHLRREVRALSSEGRASAAILLVLPVLMFAWMRVTNPKYVGELTGTTPGRWLLVAGAGLLVAGMVWMRKIIRIEY